MHITLNFYFIELVHNKFVIKISKNTSSNNCIELCRFISVRYNVTKELTRL